jgi:hypothetical protein
MVSTAYSSNDIDSKIYYIALAVVLGGIAIYYMIVVMTQKSSPPLPLKPKIAPKKKAIVTDVADIFSSANTQHPNIILENQWNMHCLAANNETRQVGWTRCYDPLTDWAIGFIDSDIILIRSNSKNRCLEEDEGGNLVLQICDSSHKPQRWKLNVGGDTRTQIVNENSDKFLAFTNQKKRWFDTNRSGQTSEQPENAMMSYWKLYPFASN